ncbi:MULTISPECIES: NAD-dependent epimerase/dehydratase family protein [Acidianus]|uniref:NAD-dependent dehydratase n=1 Tax=Candidatus Acidianus copahuensis TaxID=1160895 RepID=A0A031LTF9_9CREN|nr:MULTISPECIES: NAD-dependent epimerase/dehydratase family protein [Acidianus]EZQ11071.1 NAD-dependent dehydratase [Candidatus Acidianus copahuensis]NON63413.1 NAD-dependent epimerase/dehydratase family protein [Acidianus sp. RZ1]
MVMIVTGGAGYIGGHVIDHFVEIGEDVLSIDDFSYGKYINQKSRVIRADLRREIPEIPKNSTILHLAANPDVRTSMQDLEDHFDRDVKITLNVLEMARKYDANKFIFFSSSTVYGEAKIPTPENTQLSPISNYGLFKLIGEEMTHYYSNVYNINSVSLRLANITGGRVSHGVVIDFIKKLKKNPETLEILGNGKQRKSYLYITDLLNAVDTVIKFKGKYEVFNVGNNDWTTVNEIANIIEEEMAVKPKHVYIDTGEGRGWPGDVRFMLLDCSKLNSLGWIPKYSSNDSVRMAVRDVLNAKV